MSVRKPKENKKTHPASGHWAIPFSRVFLLSVTIGLAFQGCRGLYETTEGRYALCAKEMLQNGTWLEPTLLREPHWTKPPLAYWFIAGGLKLFGINEWGARIPVALAFAFTAVLVELLARRMWDDDRTGFYAGLVYATSFYPVAVAYSVNTDTFLALFETTAIFCYWMAWRARSGSLRKNGALGLWGALALGFATKGPPALMALIPMVFWSVLQQSKGGNEGDRRILLNPVGWTVFLVVGGGWYFLEIARHHELLRYFIGDEIVARVATDKFARNPEWYKPFKLYLPILLFGAGIWSVFPVLAAWKHRVWTSGFWRHTVPGKNRAWLFLAVWILVPLLVFSLSLSRQPNYLLPLFPAIAIGIGRWLAHSEAVHALRRRTLYMLVAAAFLLCVSGKACFAYGKRTFRDMGALAELCRPFDKPGKSWFLLCYRDGYYGLDFYLNSPVTRVLAAVPDDNGAFAIRPDVVEDLRTAAAGKVFYFIAKNRPEKKRAIWNALKGNGIDGYVAASNPDWFLLCVEPTSSEENHREPLIFWPKTDADFPVVPVLRIRFFRKHEIYTVTRTWKTAAAAEAPRPGMIPHGANGWRMGGGRVRFRSRWDRISSSSANLTVPLPTWSDDDTG